jgi:hypothetical protein
MEAGIPEKRDTGIPDDYAQLFGNASPEITHFCIIRALSASAIRPSDHLRGKMA